MNNYCITFTMYVSLDNGKIKTDYSMIPVELKNNIWASSVSNEVFSNFKKKKDYFYEYHKKGTVVFYRVIFSSDKEFEEAERDLVPRVAKLLEKKLLLKPNYRKFLRERVSRILG